MRSTIRSTLLAFGAALMLAGPALAQTDAAKPAAPAAAIMSPSIAGAASGATVRLPQPDDTNAQRAITQPGNNAPFWRGVRNSGNQAGTVNLPGAEKGVLIQELSPVSGLEVTTAGEAWRQVRNQWIIPYGGALVVIVLLALALYFFAKGPLGGHDRTPAADRALHLLRARRPLVNAIAFVVLAVSGLVMAFGKFLLLPIIGGTLFGWLTYALKNAAQFRRPAVRGLAGHRLLHLPAHNLPDAGRLALAHKGGGMFGGEEPPSHRFNAGEKLVFWGGVLLLGIVVVGSGLYLDKVLPGMAYLRGDMQIAHMVHAVGGAADDGDVPRPHLHGHDRHARRLSRDARRLCRRGLGAGAPPALVRRHQARQDPGPTLAARRVPPARRRAGPRA